MWLLEITITQSPRCQKGNFQWLPLDMGNWKIETLFGSKIAAISLPKIGIMKQLYKYTMRH